MSENATIHKFLLRVDDEIDVEMPCGAKLLYVGEQWNGQLYVWAAVLQDSPLVRRAFAIRGTGHPLLFQWSTVSYVGTVIMTSGLVWHVFDCGERP